MVNYGNPCDKDTNCPSKICEMTYINGTPDKRRCVLQQIKYGKKCDYNKDCDSNRCVRVLDNKGHSKGKRCRIINGQHIPDKDWDTDDENDPAFTKSDKWKAAKDQEFILSNTQKRIAFEGRGPITEIIVLCMEIVIYILREIVKFLYSIWKLILFIVSFPFSYVFDKGWDGWSSKNRDKNGKCIRGSYTFRATTMVKIITFAFPPFGVFLDRGLFGIGHIMFTSLLSAIFYFPGLVYALMIIGDQLCPNSVELFSKENNKGKRHQFSYGDYNIGQDSFKQATDDFKKASDFKNNSSESQLTKTTKFQDFRPLSAGCNFANIGSVNVGKNVDIIFYENNDFTGDIIRLTDNESNLHSKLDGKFHEKCMGKSITKIKSFSIRLKEPLPILPEIIDDNSVVVYLLNDFRGKNLILEKGDYNQYEIGKLFKDRISSIRIGKNMTVKLFEDKNYNRTVMFSFSKTSWVGSGGRENTFYGNQLYDSEIKGEVKNLAKYDFNDNISCMIICKVGEPCSSGGDGESSWKDALKDPVNTIGNKVKVIGNYGVNKAKDGYGVAEKTATDGYGVAEKTAKDGYGVAEKTATDGYDVTKKTATDGYDDPEKTAKDAYDDTKKTVT